MITATKAVIGDREIPLMKNIDEVLTDVDTSSSVNHVLVASTDNDDTTNIGDNHIHLEKVCK